MSERPERTAFHLTVEAPGRIGRTDEELARLGPDEVRIATLFSGISAGTEMTAFGGTSPFLAKRWDAERRLFVPGGASLAYPMPAMGYEEVGRVAEVGPAVTRLRPGQVVWGAWGHRSEHVAPEGWAAARVLPERVDPRLGIFSHIGSIALNAVLDANIHVGEHVAVFGQGVPGLMVTQLARLNGGTVIAVDRLPSRLDHARALGAAHVVDAGAGGVAERIKAITDGRGADVSIEITGSTAALHEAIRATAYNSRVVACGFFPGEGRGLALGEEFHHNRIDLVCSQISGVSPALGHRWSRDRLAGTVMGLIADGRVDWGRLVSHVVPASRAQDAFELLRDRPGDCLQVVLDFAG